MLFPLLQLAALAANVVRAGSSAFYQLTLLGQILFYAGAIAGWVLQRTRKKFWLATLPYTFCLLSWAIVVGFMRCITGRQAVTWQKAATSSIR